MGNIFIVIALGEAIIPAKIFLKLGHVGCVFSAYLNYKLFSNLA